MNPRALILAAGRGSRLQKLTEDRPKCLVELAGKPLLQWQLDALRTAGIADITVVRGYRKECLAGPGYDTLENPRWSETNMVATLRCAAEILRAGPVIVSYSDIVFHPAIAQALAQADGDLALSFDRRWHELWQARFASPLEDAETFRTKDGFVVEIGGRATDAARIEGQYMGLLRFTPAGWEAVEGFLARLPALEADRLDMTGLLRRLLAEDVRVQAVPVEGRWCEVDNERDRALYEDALARTVVDGTPWLHDWRW
jgi:L-glutamine-phosphate cytidylyltransferase